MAKVREYISLDALREDELNDFVGIEFDPTFEAVAASEEWESSGIEGVYSATQMVDWDNFSIVRAAYLCERRDADGRERIEQRKREGREKSKGGLKRVLPDFSCPICRANFRPQSASKIFCSPECAIKDRVTKSKYGAIMERIYQQIGMRKSLIAQRLVRGWTEERILSTPIQEKRKP